MKKFLKIILIFFASGFALLMLLGIVAAIFSDDEQDHLNNQTTSKTESNNPTIWERAKEEFASGDFNSAKKSLNYMLKIDSSKMVQDSASYLLAIVSDSLTADSLRTEQILRKKRRMYANMFRIKRDDFNGNIFYYHRLSPRNRNQKGIKLYLGRNGNEIWPRLSIQYAGDDWLFMEEWQFKADDRLETLSVGHFNVERDNNYDGVYEWYDFNPDGKWLGVMQALGNADDAIIRYVGQQYHYDYKLTANDKKALREMFEAYTDCAANPQLLPD